MRSEPSAANTPCAIPSTYQCSLKRAWGLRLRIYIYIYIYIYIWTLLTRAGWGAGDEHAAGEPLSTQHSTLNTQHSTLDAQVMSTLLANLLHDVPPLNMEGACKVKGAMYKQHKEEGMVRSATHPDAFISQKVFLKSFYKSRFPHKQVNLSYYKG